ncbi:MAG: PEGA domain-containing protein [Bacteroidota bacterium]
MISRIFFFSISLVFLFGCETNPPNIVNTQDEYGKVFVSSNVASAEIIVDGEFTNQFTPDTLILKPGFYTITLSKSGYRSSSNDIEVKKNKAIDLIINLSPENSKRTVIIENFSNVSCVPCVETNKILKSIGNTYANDELVIVKYATNFPSPNDPMYLENYQDADERMNIYNILFTPTVIVDGTERPISSDSNSIKSVINSKLLESSKFNINASASIGHDSIVVEGYIELLESTDIDFSNLVFQGVITESGIEYATPPGSNGETKFENVMRKMFPTSIGRSISKIETEKQITISERVELKNNWNRNNLNVILFVQDNYSKKIFDVKKLD